jgi:hypothetical protein
MLLYSIFLSLFINNSFARSEIMESSDTVIDFGHMLDGYCNSFISFSEDTHMVFIKASCIKPEQGVREENFATKDYILDYNSRKDVEVITIHISALKDKLYTQPQLEPVKEGLRAGTSITNTSQISDSRQEIITPEINSPRYIAVKTNLVAWAGTILNVAADVQVGRYISVELPLMWCPWHISDRSSVRAFAIQPEARWWLSQPGKGHFFGAHASLAWFNVRWKDDRYQDAGQPLLGAGVSYGYMLSFSDRWAGEFTLGAGYANMRYDTFYNMDNGARIDTSTRNYWGITRVGIAVVYRFNTDK